MKSNNKRDLKFVKNFKYIMIFPVVLLIASIVLGIIFGLNYDYDFRNVSTFDVKFNTTVTEVEYKELERTLDDMMSDEFGSYRIERIGEGAQNGLLVKIPNKDSSLDGDIVEIKAIIEDHLLDNFSNKATTSIVVTTTETNTTLPKNATDLILLSSLSMICIMIFVFIYNIFRYNFVSGISIVLTILLEIGMLTTVMIVARVPFNYYFVISYFVMVMSTIFISTYINNHIKLTLNDEKYNKYSNADRVYESVSKTIIPTVLSVAIIALCMFAVLFFGNASLIYTILSILIGLGVSLFASLVFNTSIWSFWYKKDKDASLRRRIEADKNKSDKKDEEKILV